MNLSTLPTIEQAQAQLDAVDYMSDGMAIRCCLPGGSSCVWLDINAEWGLKICYCNIWGFDRTQKNGIAAFELGFGPYVDSNVHFVNWRGEKYPCYFMQKAQRITGDEWTSHPDFETSRKAWYHWGYYDFAAPNVGLLDGNLVLIDTSHRERSEAARNGRCAF